MQGKNKVQGIPSWDQTISQKPAEEKFFLYVLVQLKKCSRASLIQNVELIKVYVIDGRLYVLLRKDSPPCTLIVCLHM